MIWTGISRSPSQSDHAVREAPGGGVQQPLGQHLHGDVGNRLAANQLDVAARRVQRRRDHRHVRRVAAAQLREGYAIALLPALGDVVVDEIRDAFGERKERVGQRLAVAPEAEPGLGQELARQRNNRGVI